MEGGAFFTAAPMELATEIGWNVDQSDASIAHYKEPFKLQQNIDQVALQSQTIQNDDSSEHKQPCPLKQKDCGATKHPGP